MIGTDRDAPLGSGVSYAAMMQGLLQHDAYHLGQVALLKKASRGGGKREGEKGEKGDGRRERETGDGKSCDYEGAKRPRNLKVKIRTTGSHLLGIHRPKL